MYTGIKDARALDSPAHVLLWEMDRTAVGVRCGNKRGEEKRAGVACDDEDARSRALAGSDTEPVTDSAA